MSIDYDRFDRMASRSADLAALPDVIPIVKTVYDATFVSFATAYRASHRALQNAETVRKKERSEGLIALQDIDQPYIEARTAAGLFIKDLALPKALGSLTTATDKRDAIARLLEILDSHDDEPGWAKDITDGAFGRLAPIARTEITEWIAADSGHEKAVRDRIAAFDAAYQPFLGFRDQVRASYGRRSIQYRRLLVRSGGKLVIDDPVDLEPTPVAPT